MTQKAGFGIERFAPRPDRAERASGRGDPPTGVSPAAEEQLILVDERNCATGVAGKTAVHRAGLLHRAFSIFVVDGRGRILLQQRSEKKYHSGGLWANSCCGHPRAGERTVAAARRRLDEELGLTGALSFGFFARYQAALGNGMHENEFVYVYFGRLSAQPKPDPAEVADTACLSLDEIDRRISREPNLFAVWFRHYFRNHGAEIARLSQRAARLTAL
jgi:isopentenyl-diphosphate delta-isomerase